MGVGVALCAAGFLETRQAIVAAIGCYGAMPGFGYPPGCAEAQAALALWEAVTSIGVVVGVVGFTLLVLGLVLQPEGAHPGLPYMPQYPPPVYAPSYAPPVYTPPREPRAPPPGNP